MNAQDPSAPPPTAAPPVPAAAAAASYALVSNYSTVQVISPTALNNIEYCTIQTAPSGVIASISVQQKQFDAGEAGATLLPFAQAIEQIMADPRVVAGVGDQTRELSGLLSDWVLFSVEYIDPVHAPYGATAIARVGVGQLNFRDAEIGRTLLNGVTATIDATYNNLKAAAGG